MIKSKSFQSGVNKMLIHLPAILLESDTIDGAIHDTQCIMGRELCCHSDKKTGDADFCRGIRCGYLAIIHTLHLIEKGEYDKAPSYTIKGMKDETENS